MNNPFRRKKTKDGITPNKEDRQRSDPNPQAPDMPVMRSDSVHANVSFPTPFTSRIQTPVKRVPAGKNWSHPEWATSPTYGGPLR